MKKILVFLLLLTVGAIADNISPSDMVTLVGRTILSDGNNAQPDSIRIMTYRAGSQVYDVWFNSSDAECYSADNALIFFDVFSDIDGAGGDGHYSVEIGAYGGGEAIYTYWYYDFTVGGLDVNVSSVDADAIKAGDFATGAIDADALSTDAVTEIENAVYANRNDYKADVSNLDVAVSTRLAPTTAGRTLDITTTGESGIDLDNVSGTLSDSEIDNITVSSVTGSVGSVTGAVGSVTGNVGGNVTGSVGSISGITFPTNFSDLSITVTTGRINIETNYDKAGYTLTTQDWTTDSDITTLKSDLSTDHGSGSWTTATGFSTHGASDVYTYFTNGANEDVFKADVSNLDVVLSTRSSHSAGDIWSVGTRVLTDTTNISKLRNGLSIFDPATDLVNIDTTDCRIVAETTYVKFTEDSNENQFKADISGLSTFDPSSDLVNIDTTDARIVAETTYVKFTESSNEDQFKADVTNLDATVSSRSNHSANNVWGVGTRTITGDTYTPDVNVISASDNAFDSTDFEQRYWYWIADYSDSGATGGGNGASPQEIWEYGTRTLTAFAFNVTLVDSSAGDISYIANNQDDFKADVSDLSAIKSKIDSLDFNDSGYVNVNIITIHDTTVVDSAGYLYVYTMNLGGGDGVWTITQRDSVLDALADGHILAKIWHPDSATVDTGSGCWANILLVNGETSPWTSTQVDSMLQLMLRNSGDNSNFLDNIAAVILVNPPNKLLTDSNGHAKVDSGQVDNIVGLALEDYDAAKSSDIVLTDADLDSLLRGEFRGAGTYANWFDSVAQALLFYNDPDSGRLARYEDSTSFRAETPANFSALEITAGGYVSLNFDDIAGDLDSINFSAGWWSACSTMIANYSAEGSGGLTYEDSVWLASRFDNLDAACGSGSGSEAETLYVVDESNFGIPYVGITMRPIAGGTAIAIGETDLNGRALFNLPPDSIGVYLFNPSYTFNFVDSIVGGGTDSLSGTYFSPTPPSPYLCQVWGSIISSDTLSGTIIKAVLVDSSGNKFKSSNPPRTGNTLITRFKFLTETTTSTWQISLIPNDDITPANTKWDFEIEYPDGMLLKIKAAVPDQPSWEFQW